MVDDAEKKRVKGKPRLDFNKQTKRAPEVISPITLS